MISSLEYGDILVLRPYPRSGNAWGDLAPLRGTPLEPFITVVSGASLSHALHGFVRPLMQEIGTHPHGMLRKVQEPQRTCRAAKDCFIRSKDCYPHPKVPGCFSPSGLDPEAQLAASQVIGAWAEGRYVIVVEGDEFSF